MGRRQTFPLILYVLYISSLYVKILDIARMRS